MPAQLLGMRLRPHVKTHKTREIGLLQLGHGLDDDEQGEGDYHYAGLCSGIVASTLAEARFFAEDERFSDILYGVPLCPSRIERVLDLHARGPASLQVRHGRGGHEAVLPALCTYAMWRCAYRTECVFSIYFPCHCTNHTI